MAKKLSDMGSHYAAKAPFMAKHYVTSVEGKGPDYRSGIADVLGVDPESIRSDRVDAWDTGTGRITESDFAGYIDGKEKKLMENYKRAFLA